MTIFDAIKLFLEFVFPVQLQGFNADWWDTFRLIVCIVVTCLVLLYVFIVPVYKMIKYGLFGGSAKNKKWF